MDRRRHPDRRPADHRRLCAGLALLPGVGWVLATVIMSLLITRTTVADPWPDAVLMVVGSNVVWLLTKANILGWM